MELTLECLKGLMPRDDRRPETSRNGDALIIYCRGCHLTPIPHSDECLRCILAELSGSGGAERIVLRTGMDIEISGRAGKALRQIASIRAWSMPAEHPHGRCRGCSKSREAVMRTAWDGFPGSGMDEARMMIAGEPPDRDECISCVTATSRALDQIESGIRKIISELSSEKGAMG